MKPSTRRKRLEQQRKKKIVRKKIVTKILIKGCRTLEEIEKLKGRNIKRQHQALSYEDRITIIYQINNNEEITEVVNVSYEIYIKERWVTILRYDSEHGFLHRHMRILISDDQEIRTRMGVIRRGNPHKWLTWAIDDLHKTYLDHKRGFVKRNKLVDN